MNYFCFSAFCFLLFCPFSLVGHEVVAGDDLELGDDVHGDEVDQEGDREPQGQVEDPDGADRRCESQSG